jgi:hypothetical protein
MSSNNSKPRLVVLSSSLLTERMLFYSSFLPTIEQQAEVHIWTTAARDPETNQVTNGNHAKVESFPAVLPFREFPYNYLRRLNEFTWDLSLQAPSRLSARKHLENRTLRWHTRVLEYPAWVLAKLGAEQWLEDSLEKLLYTYPRSPEGTARLQALQPQALLAMGTFRYEEPAITAAAKLLGIPTLAFITSWDNPSTKHRMVFRYDGYAVWSEEMKSQMHEFFPHSKNVPIYAVGAPQFDVFYQPEFEQTRPEFCAENHLDPSLPIVLYALGSPNLIPEMTAVRHIAESLAKGELGQAQFLVRPHPLHDKGTELDALRGFHPRVVVQDTGQRGLHRSARNQNDAQIRQWVNTFRHSDVIVNLSSTAAIDGALFDKPVVNLDFDPEPAKSKQVLVKEINHLWTHFKPVAESGGLWLVNDPAEMIAAIRAYLSQPELHRAERRKMAEFVVQFPDGDSGARMAAALLDFAQR